jgi:hypothetical protein
MAYPSEIKQNLFKQWFYIGLLVFWLLLLAAGIIWFQNSYVRPFLMQDDLKLLKVSGVQERYQQIQQSLSLPSGIKILSIWQPGCLCNQFSQRHAIALLTELQQTPVPHYTLLTEKVTDSEMESFRLLNPGSQIIDASASGVDFPPAPSLLMIDAADKVTYFGPYGFGAFCSQDDASALNEQLHATQTGHASPFLNVLGKGCFCSTDIANSTNETTK